MAAFVATSPIQRGAKRGSRKVSGAQLSKTAPKFVMEGFLTKVLSGGAVSPRAPVQKMAPAACALLTDSAPCLFRRAALTSRGRRAGLCSQPRRPCTLNRRAIGYVGHSDCSARVPPSRRSLQRAAFLLRRRPLALFTSRPAANVSRSRMSLDIPFASPFIHAWRETASTTLAPQSACR